MKHNITGVVKIFFEEYKLPGFDSAKDNPQLLQHFFVAIRGLLEIDVVKLLYTQKFIPEALKADVEANSTLRKLNLLNVHNIQSDAMYETIRFGYISLFHKYENFIKTFILFLEKDMDTQIDIRKMINENFAFDILKPNCGIGYKIGWICNCVKHQDGVASKRNYPPERFIDYPIGKKIEIESLEFLNDCNLFRELVLNILLASAKIPICIPYEIELLKPIFDKIKAI